MPSSETGDPLFTEIDWSATADGWQRPRWRTVGLVVALVGIVVLFVYDVVVGPEKTLTVLEWDLARIDWLLLISIVLLARYVVFPIAADRRRTERYVAEFRSRPAAVASLVVLCAFVLIGLFGPGMVSGGYPRLADRLQPPAVGSVFVGDLTVVYDCVGQMTGETCHGTWQYPLGTTRIGENLVTLLVQGVQIALVLGISAAMIMGIVATAVGTTAGYLGGWVDDVLMSYVDVQGTVPAIVVYVVLATLYLGNLSGVTQGGLFAVALVFGLFDWGGIARIVRSEVMARRSAGYVRAARAAGASDLHVIRRHVIPNSTGTIVTSLTRRIPLLILAQTALAYLALHRAGSKSLGRVLRIGLEGRHMPWFRKWWITTFAVLVLLGMVVAFSVFGDEVRDVIDPQSEVE